MIHGKQTAQSEGTADVSANEWNAPHIHRWIPTAVDLALDGTHDAVIITAAKTVTLPASGAAATVSGRPYFFKRRGNFAGVVTIAPNTGQTVEGDPAGYVLLNNGQHVELVWDGVSDWMIWRQN